jgi:branched-chain amino acid transport system permease protein
MNLVSFLIGVASLVAIYGILTVSLDLQFGYANMINFGLVAYVAVGAYTFAILTRETPLGFHAGLGYGLPWPAGLAGAVLAGLFFAGLTAWPCLRLRGDYLAVTTFAFAEVLHSLLVTQTSISNGLIGLSGIARPAIDALTPRENDYFFAALVLAVLVLIYLVFRRIVTSPFGQVVLAVSDDEVAAQSVGKDARRVRLQVFLIGGGLAAVAGAFYAMYVTLVTPDLFLAELTFFVWIALVLGGVRSRLGTLLGAVVLIGLQEAVRFFNLSPEQSAFVASTRLFLIGFLLVVMLRLRPPPHVVRNQAGARGSRRTRRRKAVPAV